MMFPELWKKRIRLLTILTFGLCFSFIGESFCKENANYELYVPVGHGGYINSGDISKDGRYIITSGSDGIIVWDNEGNEIRKMTDKPTGNVVFSTKKLNSSDKSVISSGKNVQERDFITGKKIKNYTGDSQSFSLSKNKLISSKDTFDGKLIISLPDGKILSLAHRFNEMKLPIIIKSYLPTAPEKRVECALYKNKKGIYEWVFHMIPSSVKTEIQYPSRIIRKTIPTNNSDYIFTGNLDGTVSKFSLNDGVEKVFNIQHTGPVIAIAVSPDGMFGASLGAYDNFIRVWDAQTGLILTDNKINRPILNNSQYDGFYSPSVSFSFSNDGYSLIYYSNGSVLSFNLKKKKITARARIRPSLNKHGFEESNIRVLKVKGDNVLLGSERKAFYVNMKNHNIVNLKGQIKKWNIISSDDSGIYINDGVDINRISSTTLEKARFYTKEQNEHINIERGFDSYSIMNNANLKVFRKGKLIKNLHINNLCRPRVLLEKGVIIGRDCNRSISVYNYNNGEKRFSVKLMNNTYTYTISEDQKKIIILGPDGILIYSLESGSLLREKKIIGLPIQFHYYFKVLTNEKMNVIVAAIDDSFVIWDLSLNSLKVIDAGRASTRSIAMDSKGRIYIANGSSIKCWDITTKKYLFEIPYAHSEVDYLGIVNGLLISSGKDGYIKAWSLNDLSLVFTRFEFADGEWLVMTPEGFFASSPKGSNYVKFRQDSKVASLGQLYNIFYRPDLVREKVQGDKNHLVSLAAQEVSINTILVSGSPPLVSVISPEASQTSHRDAQIVALVNEQDGGLGKVEWKLNGMTVGVMDLSRGIAIKEIDKGGRLNKTPTSAAGIKLSRTLTLSPGDNTIEITAYSKMGIASNPATLKLNLKDAISEKPALHILAVGVNKYRDKTLWLNYSVPDAKSLVDSMQKAGSSIFTHVDITRVYDANATKAGVQAAFQKVAAAAKSNDVFILYLAGHGITMDGRYHFLPVDFRYVNEDSVRTSSDDLIS